ncbi:MAG: ketopantoate reductase family protein [Deltaproteobacteria bacterium]|nr:ketopantoate reductase family protein [Deltaproteobacteria bacterium]
MRFVVAGAGAVGSVFGGLLAGRGHDVLLVGREPHMAAIRESGLAVTGLFGDQVTRPRVATDLARAAEPTDAVLVGVKSHATESIARTLAAWADRPRLVVSLQNGLGNVETLAASLPARVLAARVIFGAIVTAPGRAHVTVCAKPVAVGPLRDDPASEADAQRLAEVFADAGIPSEAAGATEPILWEKALYNCGLNPLGALHGLTYGEVAASEALRPLLDGAMDEAFAVARASGIALVWKTEAEFRVHFHSTLLPPTAAHRSSMRQDLEGGRPTEVDAIGGAIVRAGERHGVPTPINRRLVAEIHEAERKGSRSEPA